MSNTLPQYGAGRDKKTGRMVYFIEGRKFLSETQANQYYNKLVSQRKQQALERKKEIEKSRADSLKNIAEKSRPDTLDYFDPYEGKYYTKLTKEEVDFKRNRPDTMTYINPFTGAKSKNLTESQYASKAQEATRKREDFVNTQISKKEKELSILGRKIKLNKASVEQVRRAKMMYDDIEKLYKELGITTGKNFQDFLGSAPAEPGYLERGYDWVKSWFVDEPQKDPKEMTIDELIERASK